MFSQAPHENAFNLQQILNAKNIIFCQVKMLFKFSATAINYLTFIEFIFDFHERSPICPFRSNYEFYVEMIDVVKISSFLVKK